MHLDIAKRNEYEQIHKFKWFGLCVRVFFMLFFIPFGFYIWYLYAVAYKEST